VSLKGSFTLYSMVVCLSERPCKTCSMHVWQVARACTDNPMVQSGMPSATAEYLLRLDWCVMVLAPFWKGVLVTCAARCVCEGRYELVQHGGVSV
jgi:hypothetical protein